MTRAILTIDQGTTGTTAMVVDAGGRILGRAYGEIRQYYPRPGWVEHDPEQIYRSAVRLGRQAIAASRIRPAAIAAVGITNQRETFVVWERQSGRPVHRAIVWQCRRSAPICAALERGVRKVTDGLKDALVELIDPFEWKAFDSEGLLFKNMNTPEDYEEARARLSGAGTPETK